MSIGLGWEEGKRMETWYSVLVQEVKCLHRSMDECVCGGP